MAGARQACLILCHRELYNKEHEEKLQKKKREKKFSNILAVTQIFSKWLKMKNSDSDPFFWGVGGYFFFLPCLKLWALAVDHSARTKRFADELTLFTHSGTLQALKVRHEHPPGVMPQLDTDLKSNYHY